MLAQTAEDVAGALEKLGRANIEWKLDGARIQAHRVDDDVRVFTRNLADITERVPEIVAPLRALDVSAIVLDGEAIALRDDGRPRAVSGDDEPIRDEGGSSGRGHEAALRILLRLSSRRR